jgi:HD-GYP domain-containing protein (c-di-GMP phosphodiesterase class II)
VDAGNPAEVLAFLRSNVGLGRDTELRDAMVAEAVEHGLAHARETLAMHCEVAQRFAGWLGFPAGVQAALAHVFERWDGCGFPGLAGGEEVPLAMRLVHVARDVSVFLSAAGPAEARAVVARRAGAAYEPRLAAVAAQHLDAILAELDETRTWDQALDAEPAPQVWLSEDRVDAAFAAIAGFTDLKCPWWRQHSTSVAALAEAAAWRLGLPADSVTLVRRAALAHDLGRAGVSNCVWEKPGRLGFGDWERVRLHPHFTERAFAQSPALAGIGRLAGAHHERLDGSGYQRGTRGPDIPQAARILAAADCYSAMRESRPYRPALGAEEAEAELTREAVEGRLDPNAVDAVLAAAGHRVTTQPRVLPAGLTPREHEVLLALAGGASNQAIGDGLGISPKTAGHHVQHIYEKAGVHSRAAATLWAFEQDLVHTA